MPTALIKIFAISYNVAHTGFTRVMHSILAHLPKADFDIHYLGIGGQHDWYGAGDRVKIYPHDPRTEGDVFRSHLAKKLMGNDPPDILFVINDLWMFKAYDRLLGQFRGRTHFVTYTPFDSAIDGAEHFGPFAENSRFVAYTEFGKNETEKGVAQLRRAGKMERFPDISIIPHGVDRGRFFPIFKKPTEAGWEAGRMAAKQKVFGAELATADSFIVLNANRPTYRKRMDLTVEGFAKFAAGKPKSVKLCLHHALLMPEEKTDIEAWVRQWGIEERLIWSTVKHPDEPFTDAQLNGLYNACDVGLNTSMGEGWGMIAFEHAATGAAQILPDHSACGELWGNDSGDAALLMPTTKKEKDPHRPMLFRETSASEVAAALERLYADRTFLRSMSIKALENACRPEYDWHRIGGQWGDLFKQVVGHTAVRRHRSGRPPSTVALC